MINKYQAFRNYIINTFLRIKNQISALEPANQKVDAALLLTVLAITLPLDAFIYWRLFCENFGTEYFTFCFSVDDIAYILYYKGTFYWYIIILLTIPAIPLLFDIPRSFKALAIIVLLFAVGSALVHGKEFDLLKLIIYVALVLLANVLIYFYNRNVLYAYSLLIGLFFVITADIDASNALKHPPRMTIISKGGVTILNEKDSTRIYVGSTSKFILIYDKNKKKLDKIERDSIY